MTEPLFLSFSEVLQIHEDQISRYGGSLGIRDVGLLESALAMPAASFGDKFLHEDIFEMAAAYLFHIVKNHPFVDGNKRVGAVASLVFLVMNDIDFAADEVAFEQMVLAVAEGRMNKSAIAAFFRESSKS
ncbi:MAG TPA: type II toxin-antitoxin system death-on-curing family toxin [bacterium]|nr:type II toxin-antitoxin system death-on-curing family toxin [bacterium]